MFHNKPEWQRRADEYLESLIVPDHRPYREQVYSIFKTSHDKETLQFKLTHFKQEITNAGDSELSQLLSTGSLPHKG